MENLMFYCVKLVNRNIFISIFFQPIVPLEGKEVQNIKILAYIN